MFRIKTAYIVVDKYFHESSKCRNNLNSETIKAKARYVGVLLVLLSLYYLGDILFNNLGSLQGIDLTGRNIMILVLLLCFHFAANGISSYAWVLQLKRKYPGFGFPRAYAITGLTQIGKYLPGNVGHYVARMVLISENVKKPDVAFTLFVETLVMTFTAAGIGFFYIFYFDVFSEFGASRIGIIAIAGLFGLIAVSAGLRFLRTKYEFLSLQISDYLKVMCCFASIFLMGGFTILLLLSIYTNLESVTYFQCVTGFALSFMAGFIIPGAPGGIGIREFAFVLLFGDFVSEVVALEAILVFRVINVIGDILLFGVAFMLNKKITGRLISE